MALIRVSKPNKYQVMNITHLFDKEISCEAKGLMSLIIAHPSSSDFDLDTSILCHFTKENESDVMEIVEELKRAGYLKQYEDNIGEYIPPDFQIDV